MLVSTKVNLLSLYSCSKFQSLIGIYVGFNFVQGIEECQEAEIKGFNPS